jgi:hypothetical protein
MSDKEACDWCGQDAIETCCGNLLCGLCLMDHDDSEHYE